MSLHTRGSGAPETGAPAGPSDGAAGVTAAARGGRGTRTNAVVAGVLLILATATSLLGVPFLTPVSAPDLLVEIASHPARVSTGALLGIVAGLASTGIAVALYPVLRHSSPGLAIGAVAFRVIEGTLALVGATAVLSLVSLSGGVAGDGGLARASSETAAQALLAIQHWVADVGAVVAFSLGALLYYLAFYRSRLIPRWLAGWGVVGVVALLASAVLVIYGVIGPLSPAQMIIALPIAVQEMVLAVRLIAKGFAETAEDRHAG
ncbi:DUF4386 domain-containing protein [Actinomycetospora chibensis]|uniref:DUF4386 domain-containing protein n=1 Tax=Actinomycetospora chibensis TaxID=663606 RepID=A0ABV9RNF5_9PSEU|nr:DUF4386 domain-containing protein [Actinomycetospora chibensis]MDD7922697.1 DUF4386 domain-containing protein [Actinomycetospora chibensis]